MARARILGCFALALVASFGFSGCGDSGDGSSGASGDGSGDGSAGDGSGATGGDAGAGTGTGSGDATGGTADSDTSAGGGAADASGDPDTGGGGATDDGPDEPACNTINQTGCEEGENCTWVSDTSSTPECYPAGSVPPGGACTTVNDCAEGICLNINDTESRCYTFCQTIGHCPALAPCLDLESAPYKVCEISGLYDNCDLLAQDCEGGKGCYIIDGEDYPVCLPAGNVPTGEWCDGPSDCAPSNVCINHQCLRLCDKNAADPCGEFIACSNYWAAAGYCNEE